MHIQVKYGINMKTDETQITKLKFKPTQVYYEIHYLWYF